MLSTTSQQSAAISIAHAKLTNYYLLMGQQWEWNRWTWWAHHCEFLSAFFCSHKAKAKSIPEFFAHK